ncbi:MAG: AAA family ATPase [Clostridiales bacterium]|nr:AAA family ATPase [Clostridiales bacterium]
MIEEFKKLKIKGGIFQEETILDLFIKNDKIYPNVSIIYGKNGSGKTTIADAFRNITGVYKRRIEISEFLDNDNKKVELDEEEKNLIYVFNEEFIEENIKIQPEGLNTIMIMGEEKDIDDKIKELEPDYNKYSDLVKEQKGKMEEYENYNNIISPKYYIEEMKKELKGDGNWAGRHSKIFGNKINTIVNNQTYQKIIKIKPEKDKEQRRNEYHEGIKELDEAKQGKKKIEKNIVLDDVNYEEKEKNIIELLKKVIEEPKLSEREKRIFKLLEKENGNYRLNEIKEYFSKSEENICPYCFRNIDREYKSELVTSIEKILNKEVEIHKNELESQKLNKIEIDLVDFKEISEKLVKSCEEEIGNFNLYIEEVNKMIQQKIDNVYNQIFIDDLNINFKYKECRRLLSLLEKARKEFNEEIVNIEPIQIELEKINNEIAYYEIIGLYEKYCEQNEKYENEKNKYENLTKEEEKIRKAIEILKQKKENTIIAMEEINNDLEYIFYSNERLQIKNEGNKYILYSNNKKVNPVNVSMGERNAIGLCYYFNYIMKNKEKNKAYDSKYLLVIDDPISSFDMENQIGMLSYLKYKLSQYIKGNKESKILILTHDIQSFYNLNKIIEEIYECFGVKKIECINLLKLSNRKVSTIEGEKINEYTTLLKKVFNYSKEINEEDSYSIGNIMRKVVEAFSTFIYKKGINKILYDEEIMKVLDEGEQKYYENIIFKIMFNMESHMEEKVKRVKFSDYISDNEKQRTARDIICLLYKLNPIHIKEHLRGEKDLENKIKEWEYKKR